MRGEGRGKGREREVPSHEQLSVAEHVRGSLCLVFHVYSGQEMLTIRRPIQMSSLAEAEVEQAAANLTANNDWRIAQGSSVRLDQIPTWVEQIHLKGIETVHVS